MYGECFCVTRELSRMPGEGSLVTFGIAMPDKKLPRMAENRCEEDSRCKASHALFSIRSDFLDPAAISTGLGIAPSQAWAKGEEYLSKAGPRRRPWGMWHLSTEGVVASRSPEQQALYLLERLEPKADFLCRFVENSDYLVVVS